MTLEDTLARPSSFFHALRSEDIAEPVDSTFWGSYELVKQDRMLAAWRHFREGLTQSIFGPEADQVTSRYLLYHAVGCYQRIDSPGLDWLHLIVAAGLTLEVQRWIRAGKIRTIHYWHACFELGKLPDFLPLVLPPETEEIAALLVTYELEQRCFSRYYGTLPYATDFLHQRQAVAIAHLL